MGTIGLILMGGQNSRMGGAKKALLSYRGKYFYEHIRQAMADAGIGKIFVSVEQSWEPDLGIPQIVDEYEQIGPLGGIVTALERMAEPGLGEMPEGIFVMPCDVPRISAVLLQEILTRFEKDRQPVVLFAGSRPNPLIAVYTKACLPVLKAQIAEGNFRATHWISKVPHGEVELVLAENGEYYFFTDSAGNVQYLPVNTISNINSKEDYASIQNMEGAT